MDTVTQEIVGAIGALVTAIIVAVIIRGKWGARKLPPSRD